ncbi:hypothetical protein [Xanthobacter flavus]|uniref:hypothetical protein n=1 Tax=Xanthobacter flavus TaxID=281 RepID=UPI00372CD487
MSVKKLIDFFSTFQIAPVEVADVRDQIVESYNVTDDIIIMPVNVDPTMLRGLYFRYREKTGPYSNKSCSVVLYSGRLSLPWQRLVCAKELIHILDESLFKTSTPEDVSTLVDKLVSRGRGTELGRSDVAAFKDHIALYQALAVLVPEEIREDVVKRYESGEMGTEEVADLFCIPLEYVLLVLSPDWPEIVKLLKDVD